MTRRPLPRRFYLARVYANYDEAVRTIQLVSEHGDLERAEGARRRLVRGAIAVVSDARIAFGTFGARFDV